MEKPQPILVTHLFPEILEHLLALLSGLSADEWDRPTACALWSVKDVALHLLGVEVGILSRKRDGYAPSGGVWDWAELVELVNRWNAGWVEVTRRMSTRLLCDLLAFAGAQVCEYYRTLDPTAMGGPVSWAGPEPAPVWLDLAREYTERWLHQQHIRDAVGRPGLKQPRFLAPVLDTFVRALPHTYRDTDAAAGTMVQLTITGDAGQRWGLLREGGRWDLYLRPDGPPDAEAIMDEDVAWRLFTRELGWDQSLAQVTIVGDRSLGLRMLDVVSIIA
ncbi:MAG: maleylpyruvate isomerase family mycothiol-dependent enzyme [Chloroflexi bacterium]|nr:maleylpyruvate isomerase family mycothiol-dependent enzyme [Chloroflexota bacterium]MBU1748627.1 maleylpyruvate isomerase family mycothiol-dependent enzyme [Chloroflexota bacterium]MBU1880093.1 maleylpyruvate isomerase family mycothiol-dependent enzyme [Chloroflexota bacterium]